MTRPGAPLAELLLRAGSRPTADAADADAYRATLTVLSRVGTRHVTMDEIAAEHGVSRMTLFRRYGTKDQILESALAWLMNDLFAETERILSQPLSPAEQVVEVFVVCCRFGRSILPPTPSELFDGDTDFVDVGIAFVQMNIEAQQAEGIVPAGAARIRADALVRLTIGCFVASPPPFDLGDDDAARAYARIALAPVLMAPAVDAD